MSSGANGVSPAGTIPEVASESASDLDRLRIEIGRRRVEPFLVTITAQDQPHCGIVTVDWDASRQRLTAAPPPKHWDTVGATVGRHVTVLWPPNKPGGYSLIVDGTATAVETAGTPALAVAISRAVLHRRSPAPLPAAVPAEGTASDDAPCRSDCILIVRTAS